MPKRALEASVKLRTRQMSYAGAEPAIYPMAYETFAVSPMIFRDFIDEVYNARRLHSASGYLNPPQFEDRNPRPTVKSTA